MTFKTRSLSMLFLITLLFSIVAFSGLTPSDVRALSDDDGDDADLPSFARGIDKQEYLQRRDAHIALLRGLDNPDAPKARSRAIREMEAQERLAPEVNNQTWQSIGPAPIPNGQTTSVSTAVSGRTTAIAIHPTNPNIVYVGTAQGGVYRTLDGGVTWNAIMDSALSLAIGAVTIDPLNTSTVLVGTGEGNLSADSYFGVGLYIIKNADSAPVLTGPFNHDSSSNDIFTNRSIVKVLVSPTDDNIVFCATSSGIGGIGATAGPVLPARGLYRSTNAMSATPTFSRLTVGTGTNNPLTSAVFEPGNPNNLVCSVFGFNPGEGGIYRSTNALAASPTFNQSLALGTGINVKLAVNKVSSTVTVIAGTDESSGTIRRSVDGGATFSAAIGGTGFCGGQCFYDIAPALDPNNASIIYMGGSADGGAAGVLKKTTNGATFVNIDTGLHADTHAVEVAASPNNATVYFGSDGGIWRSTDSGTSWTSLNNTGFNATQFQSIALHPSDREFMIGGTQDNGTEFKKPDGTWTRADFGDGGYALIDQNAADTKNVTMYHTYFNQTNNLLALARVTTTANAHDSGWAAFGCGGTANGISCTDAVNFYAPMALGPGNPNTLYYGSDHLYRSVNQGATMAAASQVFATGVPVSSIGISPQNDNVRLVGLNNGRVFATTTGANPMTDVTGAIPARYIARAVIDPTNANTAYVVLGGFSLASGQHVWKTINLNNATPTWTASGTGIPDVPVNGFVVDPADVTHLYAGTDIGVYRSTDSGTSWTPYGTGLPRVAVFDMAIQSTNRVLRVATHGRGIWEISISPFSLDAFYKSFPGNTTGNGTVNVTGPNGPAWTASTAIPWIHITNGGPGTGNGAVTYTVDINPSTSANRSGTITIASQTYTVYQGAAFLDVAPANPFYDDIGRLSARGITVGCSGGGSNFCPNDAVTREQMAAFIVRSLGEFSPPTPASQRFTDVPPANVFYNFIDRLAVLGITVGCNPPSNTMYCPSSAVTREQMAAFIIRALGDFSPPPPPMQRFTDVQPSNVFYAFIDQMAVLNITLGCTPDHLMYCPSDPVIRAQMAAFLVRAFNL